MRCHRRHVPPPLAACALARAVPVGACGDDGRRAGSAPAQPVAARSRRASTGTRPRASSGSAARCPGASRIRARRRSQSRRYGCTLSERWEARPERYAEWRYCITGATWRLRSVTDYHEFFGNAQRRAYRCSGRAVPRPERIEPGFRWTDRCRARRTTAVARGEVLGDRARRGRRESGSPRCTCGCARGSAATSAARYTMDSWLRRTDGLLLRRIFSSDSRVRGDRRAGARARGVRADRCARSARRG